MKVPGRPDEARRREASALMSARGDVLEEIEVLAAKTPSEPRRYSRYAPNAIVQPVLGSEMCAAAADQPVAEMALVVTVTP